MPATDKGKLPSVGHERNKSLHPGKARQQVGKRGRAIWRSCGCRDSPAGRFQEKIAVRLGETEYPATARAHVRTIAATLSDCLDSLDDRGLADRCATLATLERSTPPSSQEVFNLVLEAVSPDPIADLVAHFVEDEPTATGRVITLHATLPGDGVVEILAAWHLVEVAAPVAIIAQTATDGELSSPG